MFNDANSDPTLPGRLVDRNRVTVNPKTGDVMEVGGHVNLDPVIVTGKMPDNLKQTINKNIESDRIQNLLYKDRLSPVDPVASLLLNLLLLVSLQNQPEKRLCMVLEDTEKNLGLRNYMAQLDRNYQKKNSRFLMEDILWVNPYFTIKQYVFRMAISHLCLTQISLLISI